jgi:hypothetical protein
MCLASGAGVAVGDLAPMGKPPRKWPNPKDPSLYDAVYGR